jgi:hypothetical protein
MRIVTQFGVPPLGEKTPIKKFRLKAVLRNKIKALSPGLREPED